MSEEPVIIKTVVFNKLAGVERIISIGAGIIFEDIATAGFLANRSDGSSFARKNTVVQTYKPTATAEGHRCRIDTDLIE